MKQSTTCFRLRILPAILVVCFSGVAQQRQDTPANQELALEVNTGFDRPWEILAFNGGGGEAYTFRRLRSWKPSSEESPVVSIGFKISREAEIVIAHLSVRLENDKEAMVGTYRLSQDETINGAGQRL